MVVRVFVFETRGGALLQEVYPSDTDCGVEANAADEVKLTIDLTGTTEGRRDWRNLATPWKHSIAVDVGGRVYGGPIMPSDLTGDDGNLTVTARGIRVALARRSVLPLAALTTPLTTPEGVPDESLDSSWSGYDLGTIGMLACQQAFSWPGWSDIPIVWHAAREGSSERTYPAIERKKVDDVLSDLSEVQGGPDFRFQLRWADESSFEWVFESGTAEQPRLESPDVLAWEVGQASGLSVSLNPSRMGSIAWSQGGRADDTALVRMAYDSTLVDRGFPLLELETDASSNTVLEETLDAWNAEALRTAVKPWEFWSFSVPVDNSPFPNEYSVGDLVDLLITQDAPIPGGYIPAGEYRRRIAALSFDFGDWVTVTCGEVYDA